jgi:hypothetical protein
VGLGATAQQDFQAGGGYIGPGSGLEDQIQRPAEQMSVDEVAELLGLSPDNRQLEAAYAAQKVKRTQPRSQSDAGHAFESVTEPLFDRLRSRLERAVERGEEDDKIKRYNVSPRTRQRRDDDSRFGTRSQVRPSRGRDDARYSPARRSSSVRSQLQASARARSGGGSSSRRTSSRRTSSHRRPQRSWLY